MDEYLTLLGTLLGAIIGAAIGAILTYVGASHIERQHRKRELTDRVYGPMFKETSRTLDAVKSFRPVQGAYSSSSGTLGSLTDDYLFFTIRQGLKGNWSEVMDRVGKYYKVQFAAELILDDITRNEIEKNLGINITGSSGGAKHVWLALKIGKTMASSLDFESAIFLKSAPQNFIKREKEKWGEDVQVDVTILGQEKTLKEFESLYTTVLAKMEKEPLYRMEREQRTRLIEELENLLRQLEPYVKPK